MSQVTMSQCHKVTMSQCHKSQSHNVTMAMTMVTKIGVTLNPVTCRANIHFNLW